MTFYLQIIAILCWGFRHVGEVGVFYPSSPNPLQSLALGKLGVGVPPNLKPQHINRPSKSSRAKVLSNIDVSAGGYSPYGRGQTLQCLPIPYGKASARASKKFPNPGNNQQRSDQIRTAVFTQNHTNERKDHE